MAMEMDVRRSAFRPPPEAGPQGMPFRVAAGTAYYVGDFDAVFSRSVDHFVLFAKVKLRFGIVRMTLDLDTATARMKRVYPALERVETAPAWPLPIPALPSPDHALLAGLLTTDDRQYLVLDGQALRENAELAAFGTLNLRLDPQAAQADPAPGDAAGQDEHRVIPSVRKFLTYSIGVEAATPLEQIDEILPYPSHHLSLDEAPLIGMFTHRRTTIPLINLPVLLGRPHTPDPGSDRVLLVTVAAGTTAGLVVPELHAIEQSVWEESAKATNDLLQRPLVSLGTPEDNRLVPSFDLIAIAAEHLNGQRVRAAERGSPALR